MNIVGSALIYSLQEMPIYVFCFLLLVQILSPNNSSKPIVTHLIFFK